ncbi:hypothetical protein CHUAL_010720 [Chamberlinius hualienensis]
MAICHMPTWYLDTLDEHVRLHPLPFLKQCLKVEELFETWLRGSEKKCKVSKCGAPIAPTHKNTDHLKKPLAKMAEKPKAKLSDKEQKIQTDSMVKLQDGEIKCKVETLK